MKEKRFVFRSMKGNLVLLCTVIFVAVVLIAVLTLLPKRNPSIGNTELNGLARNFMFPFVYTTDDGALQVIRDNSLKVTEVDDTVTSCVHDSLKGNVYYIRSGALYEYDITNDRRKELISDVKEYALSEDRSAIFCVSPDNTLKLYNGKESVILSEGRSDYPSALYSMGSDEVLFAEEYDAQTSSARICKANMKGEVVRYDIRINTGRSFSFVDNGNSFFYYRAEDDVLCIADNDGKSVHSFTAAMPVNNTRQASLLNTTTEIINYNASVPAKYIVTELSQNQQNQNGSSSWSSGKLIYTSGGKTTNIADNVSRIIYYSSSDDLLLFAAYEGDQCIVYKSHKGEAAERQISCPQDASFIYDNNLNYLYYQYADGTLYRYNIYDVNLKTVKVAETTGSLYDYPNKPFTMYLSSDKADVYLIHKNNFIDRYSMNTEERWYGSDDTVYLLLRTYGENKMSLDIVRSEGTTRICSDVQQSIFFDKNINNILYVSQGTLYHWSDGNVTEVEDYTGSIKAVRITG